MIAAHSAAASALGAALTGQLTWGWHGRTLGRRALHTEYGECWLRLLSASPERASGKLWEGNALAGPLFPGVHKPELHAVHDMEADGFAYRAELTGYTRSPVLSPDPVLSAELDLAPEFLEALREDVRIVNQAVTDRIAVRQEWIDRVVPEMTGQEPPQIRTWECAHGDFHPANITQDGTILDWEGFGMAPAGYDAATLYVYSLLAPKTAARIFEEFSQALDGPDGRQALLVVATELLQAASRGAHSQLVPDLAALARRCG